MKIILLILSLPLVSYSQTGPGGVGTNDGTSTLKIWYNASSSDVYTTGSLIDSIINSAGINALNIYETGAQRPTLVNGVVNGFDEISFSGTNRLRTGLTLTTTNFVTNQASSFVVCRADNTTQASSVYTTDPLGSTRFSNHIPWAGTVYYDIGTCCGTSARIQVGGLTGLTSYSYWSYDANPTTGKQLYRNGALLQNSANTTTYSSHATQRFNIGGNTSGTNGFVGDVAEVIIFTTKINTAQRIIIENYLSAKFNITSSANDLYDEDNVGNGDYDFDVAGIGRVDATNIHNDAQGTGIVRILNPTGLDDDEFLIWGHDNGFLGTFGSTDFPVPLQGRWFRTWRVSEVNSSSTAVDVGNIDVRFDLTGLGSVTASDLRLLVDTDNDGVFADETPIAGATSIGGNVYQFTGVSAIANNLRFTLGTINISQTPLPIELISFNATVTENNLVKLDWNTASEINNDYFTVQRSKNAIMWENLITIDGAGNSSTLLNYETTDFNPYSDVSYYLLKQTDFDGEFSYSNIVSVDIQNSATNQIEIYPNPTENQITIVGNSNELEIINVYNILREDITYQVTVEKNKQKIVLDLSELSSGIYYIKTKTTANKVYKQ